VRVAGLILTMVMGMSAAACTEMGPAPPDLASLPAVEAKLSDSAAYLGTDRRFHDAQHVVLRRLERVLDSAGVVWREYLVGPPELRAGMSSWFRMRFARGTDPGLVAARLRALPDIQYADKAPEPAPLP
jgi:hypothetical protein